MDDEGTSPTLLAPETAQYSDMSLLSAQTSISRQPREEKVSPYSTACELRCDTRKAEVLMSSVTAFEEVGLPIDTTRIRYLTTLPPFLARSMMLVTPVVCFNLDYSIRVRLYLMAVSASCKQLTRGLETAAR